MSKYISSITVIGNKLVLPDGTSYRCAIGREGFTNDKVEGDGRTPLGLFELRECLYRPDRAVIPPTIYKLRALTADDGWCDDAKSPDYNHMILRPYDFSHECLWRRDNIYDVIIPISYNDNPAIPGKGSAIFLHIAKPGYPPTEGCVAISLPDMMALVPRLSPQCQIEIKAE